MLLNLPELGRVEAPASIHTQGGTAAHRTGTVVDPDQVGSVYYRLSWIGSVIYTDHDPDPATLKLTTN